MRTLFAKFVLPFAAALLFGALRSAHASYAPLAVAVAAATAGDRTLRVAGPAYDGETVADAGEAPAVPARIAAGADASPFEAIAARVARAMAIRYPEARIELTRPVNVAGGEALVAVDAVEVLEETPRAELRILVRGRDADGRAVQAQAYTAFAAWAPARVAVRRILPGEKLSPELFTSQDTNVASGQNREFRGVILESAADVANLESRQTILEGQLLLSTAVQRIPDVRRGDAVRVHMVSGSLTVNTLGTAEEPAYVRGRVRILTAKTKRELIGTLQPGGVVEVSL